MYFDEVISNEWNISTALDVYSLEYPNAKEFLRAIKSDLTRISKNPNLLKSAREKSEALLDRWNDVKKRQRTKETGEPSTAKPATVTTYNNSNHFTTSGDHSNIIVRGDHHSGAPNKKRNIDEVEPSKDEVDALFQSVVKKMPRLVSHTSKTSALRTLGFPLSIGV